MKRLDQCYEPVAIANQDDVGSNRSSNRPLLEMHEARLQRRAVLRGFVTTAAAGALGGTFTSKVALAAAEGSPSSLGFQWLRGRGPDPLG
jgi:hypothetical protein